ncbi:MAG TPA: YdjY domain-containing protein [Thermoguttaceae bacterium]|nr:YdjY domain-containing protein [Thermoguttaceae bacterium]
MFSARLLLAAAVLVATACDRPAHGQPADSTETSKPQDNPHAALGQPLVDQPENLKRLDPARPLWIDLKNRRVVMIGQVCQREAMLEMFACLRDTKEHESVLSVDVEAFKVHAGLLAVGAQVGHPVKFDPVYAPAAGTEIEIALVYKDEKDRRRKARAQDWIHDAATGKAMAHPFVFAGSGFWKDEQTGKRQYFAEGGDFICVSNFSSAMLDVPIQSSQGNDQLMFRAFTKRIPPLGTPVTMILTPKLEEKG